MSKQVGFGCWLAEQNWHGKTGPRLRDGPRIAAQRLDRDPAARLQHCKKPWQL